MANETVSQLLQEIAREYQNLRTQSQVSDTGPLLHSFTVSPARGRLDELLQELKSLGLNSNDFPEIELSTSDRVYLRKLLTKSFDLKELHTLAFDINIDKDELTPTKSGFIEDLISKVQRKRKVSNLVLWLLEQQLDDFLIELLGKLRSYDNSKKVQITIATNSTKTVRSISTEQIYGLIVEQLNIQSSDFSILGLAMGEIENRLLVLIQVSASAYQQVVGRYSVDLNPNINTNRPYRIIFLVPFEALDPAIQKAWSRAGKNPTRPLPKVSIEVDQFLTRLQLRCAQLESLISTRFDQLAELELFVLANSKVVSVSKSEAQIEHLRRIVNAYLQDWRLLKEQIGYLNNTWP